MTQRWIAISSNFSYNFQNLHNIGTIMCGQKLNEIKITLVMLTSIRTNNKLKK